MIPTVSIICPIRNEEKYIGACLESLVNQTFTSTQIEILVVDGMSDDRTREIVREIESQHSNIILIDNPQRFVVHGLNTGIKQARGKYILRMDGHAKAAHDYVERCVQALEQNDVQCVGGPIITVDDTDTGRAISLAMSSRFGVGNSRFRTSVDKPCYVDTLAFPAYRREVFDEYGLFDVELIRCQDDEYNFRLRKFGGKILLTPLIKSWYYSRSGFKKLWRQYFGYGYFKVRVLQKHFWMMQARHFVPGAFVASFFCSFFLLWLEQLFVWIFPTILLTYLLASFMAALAVSRQNPKTAIHKLLFSFYILHFSYGSGFLWGLVRFAPLWLTQRRQNSSPTGL